jgi:hypothetical protein
MKLETNTSKANKYISVLHHATLHTIDRKLACVQYNRQRNLVRLFGFWGLFCKEEHKITINFCFLVDVFGEHGLFNFFIGQEFFPFATHAKKVCKNLSVDLVIC